jgi:hypothetical protein
MRYKNFEIRPVPESQDENKFELVDWYKETSCYVIAFIEYDSELGYWQINSVGMRLMEDWEDGLDKYILSWIKLMEVCMEDNKND